MRPSNSGLQNPAFTQLSCFHKSHWRAKSLRAPVARVDLATGKRTVSRLIAYAMHCPVLFDRAVSRLERRQGMAHTLIGVTGEFVPARAVLNPAFLGRMVL